MQTHRFALSALNPAIRIFGNGNYFRYMSSGFTWGNALRIQGDDLDVTLIPGQAVRLPKAINDWQVTAGDGNTGYLLAEMDASVVIGIGGIEDQSVTSPDFNVFSVGNTLVSNADIKAHQWDFVNGACFTNLTRYASHISVTHDGSFDASVDVFLVGGSVSSSVQSTPSIRLDGTDYAFSTNSFAKATAVPGQMVLLDRVSVAPKGVGRLGFNFTYPPKGILYLSPNVQGGDLTSQMRLSLTDFSR